MLKPPNITVKVSTDFEDLDQEWVKNAKLIVYTGPLDQYFKDAALPTLQYRSIHFHTEYFLNCKGYILPNSVVNYPQEEVKFTRSVEYKNFLHQYSEHSLVISETSSSSGDPYYPVPDERNKALYEKYKALADQEEATGKVIFVGRLANYKYFTMDQAILNSLEAFQSWYENVFSHL
jgi:UDP-galactopyranose mutase